MNAWVIWSEEHGAWWRGGHGYTRSLTEAGRFTEEEARAICYKANMFAATWQECCLPDPIPPIAKGRMMKVITELSGWYWLDGEFYIISDAPGAELRQKEHPEIKALPLAELEKMKAVRLDSP